MTGTTRRVGGGRSECADSSRRCGKFADTGLEPPHQDTSDEDAALEEEQEALRLQRQAAQALRAADFDQARGQHSLLCALLSPFGVHRLTQPNLSP